MSKTQKDINNLLKPCPFCGLKSIALHSKPLLDGTVILYSLLHKPTIGCGVSLTDSDVNKLFDTWNRKEKKNKNFLENNIKKFNQLIKFIKKWVTVNI